MTVHFHASEFLRNLIALSSSGFPGTKTVSLFCTCTVHATEITVICVLMNVYASDAIILMIMKVVRVDCHQVFGDVSSCVPKGWFGWGGGQGRVADEYGVGATQAGRFIACFTAGGLGCVRLTASAE